MTPDLGTEALNTPLTPEEVEAERKLTAVIMESFANREQAMDALADAAIALHMDRVLEAAKNSLIPMPLIIKASILKVDCASFLARNSAGKQYTAQMKQWVASSLDVLKGEFKLAEVPWPQGGVVADSFSAQTGVGITLKWGTAQYSNLLADYVEAIEPVDELSAEIIGDYVKFLRAGGKKAYQTRSKDPVTSPST